MLAHASGNMLLIQLVRYCPGALSFAPEVKDLLDDPILFGVDHKLSIEPVVAVGEDRRAHLGGPLRFFLRSFGGSSKCVAPSSECLADRSFSEARLLFDFA